VSTTAAPLGGAAPRLPSEVLARQARTLANAARGAWRLVGLSLLASAVATLRVEAWSRSARSWATPEAVLDALAVSYVARDVDTDGSLGAVRLASDLGARPAIIAYYSVDGEDSAILLRDIAWLTERFLARGLHVVAISVDGPSRAADIRAEMARREYPYNWVMDTDEHAMRLRQSHDMPMAFLVVGGRIVKRSFGIDQQVGRSVWGGMRVQTELDEVLPPATAR
jgi:hypothetical protein